MFEALVKLILWIIGKISNVIILPIVAIISASIPSFTDLVISFESYCNDYVFSVMAFVKRVFVNFGCPQIVFTFLVSWYTFKLTIMVAVRLYALIHNIYTAYKP